MQKNNRYTGLHGLLVVVMGTILFSLLSCGRKVPSEIIQPGKMEDILYDYHMLLSIRNVCQIDSNMSKEYLQTMFDKYEITQQDFDASMAFYLRHSDMLQNIYSNLSERIEKEAVAQGIEGGNYDYSGGDTANVWRFEKAHVFSSQVPYNVMQFSIPVDTAFKAGDKLLLSFKCGFLTNSGSRSGLAVLTMKLKNDSVITNSVYMSGSSNHTLEVYDAGRVGIKSVQGFFLQKNSSMITDFSSSSPCMMVVSDIRLIRMHTKDIKENEGRSNADSTGVARPDTVNPRPGVSPPPTAKPKEYGPGDTSTPLPSSATTAKPSGPAVPIPPAGERPARGVAPNLPTPAKPTAQ